MNDESEVPSIKDPIWIDKVWLDTVVVLGLTCFILCLKGLGKVGIATLVSVIIVSVALGLIFMVKMYVFVYTGFFGKNGHALRYRWYDCSDCGLLARHGLHVR
jgi:hypothetical protein